MEDTFSMFQCYGWFGVCRVVISWYDPHPCRKVKMDRSTFLVDPILGHPYGTQFELHKGVLTRVHATTAPISDPDQSCMSSAGSDNRHINDDAGKAQLLSQEEIAEMKSAGISGQVWAVWSVIVVTTIVNVIIYLCHCQVVPSFCVYSIIIFLSSRFLSLCHQRTKHRNHEPIKLLTTFVQ